MHEMMRRLDVDPCAFIRLRRGEVYAEARARCLACNTIGDCLRWLDGYAQEGESPDFCPNLQSFYPCRRRALPEGGGLFGRANAAGFPEPALPGYSRER